MLNKYIILLIFLSGFGLNSEAQTEKIESYNEFIHTSNEYVHGMLIVHRILENLNQEVNKFVDLQSNQFNFYGNKDLPKDIFMDPEGWFFEIPPSELKKQLIEDHDVLDKTEQQELLSFIREMSELAAQANSLRFELESYINENDLSLDQNQITVFKKLETCEYVYDRFFEVKSNLHRYIDSVMEKQTNADTQSSGKFDYSTFSKIQKKMKRILEYWHFDIDVSVASLKNDLVKELNYLKSFDYKNRYYLDAIAALDFGLKVLDNYLNGIEIPQKYDLYGNAYYFHNVELLACLNKYGKGFVINSNKFLKSTNQHSFYIFEEPHFFKVIYPEKKVDISSTVSSIDLIPAKIEERQVIIKQQKIQTKTHKVLLEIFDHKKEDGDIVSLNFNGNWILKKKRLAKRPFKFVIELNEKGENYLLLHAENLGEIPPNTIAVRYYIDGQPKLVELNSDLNQSEMILLEVAPKEAEE